MYQVMKVRSLDEFYFDIEYLRERARQEKLVLLEGKIENLKNENKYTGTS